MAKRKYDGRLRAYVTKAVMEVERLTAVQMAIKTLKVKSLEFNNNEFKANE